MKKIILGAGAVCAAGLLAGAVESNAGCIPISSDPAVSVCDNKDDWLAAVAALPELQCTVTTEDFEDEELGENHFLTDVTVETVNGEVRESEVNSPNQVWWDRVRDETDDTGYHYDTTEWIFTPSGDPSTTYGFGGNWNLKDIDGQGTEILVETADAILSVDVIESTLAGEFWGFVSNVPFRSVILLPDGTGRETYDWMIWFLAAAR